MIQKFVANPFYATYIRRFSSTSNEFREAWKCLGEKVVNFVPTAMEERIVQQERPWALAPDVYYKLYPGNNNINNIFISWLGKPEWNIKIELKSCKNKYKAEVTALFYTMIYAHYKKTLYVSLYSDNEIVVKVASGQYQAKACKEIFDKIQRRMTDDNDFLRARISYLDANLAKVKSIVEPKKQTNTFQLFSEDDFLDKMSGSVAKIVHTTGYTYKHRDGRLVGKYGIYFDEGDGRNRLEDIYGKEMTHVAAKIYAIIQAIKLTEKNVDLTIKTDLNINSWDLMKKWAEHDFRRFIFPYEKMPNADLLQELYNIIEESQQQIDLVYTAQPAGEKNPVAKLILEEKYKSFKPYFPSIDLTMEQVKTINDFSSSWPTVYTSGVLKSSSKGFLSAGYSTFWPENEIKETSHRRLAMMPVTLFRAEMSAIILALEQAEKNKLDKVLVVTDSPYFLKHWKNGWKTIKGDDISNKYLYNRIYDLVHNRRMIVRFRYEKADDSSIWKTVKERCEQSLMLPLSSADTSDYDKTPSDIATKKCPLVDAGEKVCRVRFFKKGTQFTSGLLWDKVNSTDAKIFMAKPPGAAVDVLLAILKHAIKEKEDIIIIRTDSTKFPQKIESWMPVWKRSGWRNSRQLHIPNWEKWEEADQLLGRVRVYWELMDPPLPEDIEELEKIAPRRRKNRKILKEEDDSGDAAVAAKM